MTVRKILLCACFIAMASVFFALSVHLARVDSRINLQSPTSAYTQTHLALFTLATSTATSLATSTTHLSATKQATTTPTKKKSTSTEIVPQNISLTQPVSTPTQSNPASTQKPTPDFAVINTTARLAVVNIICTTQVNGALDPITATGVVIDPRGIILTNAHVGQYWLLQNFHTPNFVTCQIRTGSPAYPRYNAELLYISPTWVKNNSSLLTETNPQGTGENDFALLRITDALDHSPLPTFPYLPPDTREVVTVGEPVDLVSYPAGFLGGMTILQDLNLTSALTTVQKVFTFGTNTIDLLSVGGTIVSQKGASGGAVVDGVGTLIGLISTESDGSTTAQRDLRAITLAHISRTLENETGYTLTQFLSTTTDLAGTAYEFQTNVAPGLSKLIEDQLVK